MLGKTDSTSNPLAFWRWALHWQVILGIALGVGLGYLSSQVFDPKQGGITGMDRDLYKLFGDMFMHGLKMLIVPLIMSSIISALITMGQQAGFKRMGLKTLTYYVCTSFIAITIGLVLVNLIQPGKSDKLSPEDIQKELQQEDSLAAKKHDELIKKTGDKDAKSFLNTFRKLIPPNIVSAMASPNMLGLIFFSILFGYYTSKLKNEQRTVIESMAEAIYAVMIKITFFVLRFLPIGVMFLIANETMKSLAEGDIVEKLFLLSKFVFTALAALGLHLLVVLPIILMVFGKVNPIRHFKAISRAMMTAFSTASSSATLPITQECIQNRAGVSKGSSSFVLSLGATVNMDGTALYECVAVMFMAQLYGIDLSVSTQALIVVYALLTSIGVAGVPSASLVAITVILAAVNGQLPEGQHIPNEALAIILIFDRLLDMVRTMVNISGDSVGAVVIAKSEGEEVLVEDPDVLEARLKSQHA